MSTKNQDKQMVITSGQSLIELEPDQLRAVVGGSKNPKIEVTVKPDGTIVIRVN